MSLVIVHEDEQLIVVDKPAGLPVIPGRNLASSDTLIDQINSYLGAKAFVVHRLDRETSGLVLFAKDAATHRNLCGQFEKRTVTKIYQALVLGHIEKDETIDSPIRQFGSGRMGIGPEGKPASTAVKVVGTMPAASLLEVTPATGRRHQIRVHLYSIGHPIMGDPLYGVSRPVGGCPRLMLHAETLRFTRANGAALELRAMPGSDWLQAILYCRELKPPE